MYTIQYDAFREEFNLKSDALDRAEVLSGEYPFVYVYDENNQIIWTDDLDAEDYFDNVSANCIYY